jgi:hypothetical protein
MSEVRIRATKGPARPIASAAVVLFLLCKPALAHSFFEISSSTPVSPPAGFEWLAFVTLAAIWLVNTFLLRLFRIARWRTAIPAGFLTTAGFALAFYLAVVFHAGVTRFPLWVPGSPSPVFWGLGWGGAGAFFVIWNLVGLLVLLCASGSVLIGWVCGGRAMFGVLIAFWASMVAIAMVGVFGALCLVPVLVFILLRLRSFPQNRRRSCRFVVAVNLLLYVGGILPYVASGALGHGSPGTHVFRGCEQRMSIIGKALAAYAIDHDGTLPEAASIEELMLQIQPYVEPERTRYGFPVTVCPLEGAYERHAKPYEWNRRYSGAPATSVPSWPDAEADYLLRCPHHKETGRRAHFAFTVAFSSAD